MQALLIPRLAKPMRRQSGFVLVTGLLFLVIVTLLGLALFRGTGLLERLSANSRDKQRAFETAQAALQYGEWWLGNNSSAAKSSCMASTGNTTATIHVCTETLPATRSGVASLSWAPNAFTYQQPNLTARAGGGMTANQDIKYQALPGVFIEDLGLMSSGTDELYQLTAYGYGGNADTQTIVRSTYKVTSPTTCLSCNP